MKRLGGVYLATVMGAGDPLGNGRLQVTVPTLGLGPMWAPVCNGGAGRVGGRAVVAFESGDPDRPIVLGFLG